MGTIDVHEDHKGVYLENNTVALDARVQYPEKVTPYYSNLFSGTDLVDWPTDDRKQGVPYHTRVWFQTEKVNETKMVVTMDSRGVAEPAEKVKSTQYDNYLELEFDDGSVAYVSLETDETKMIDAGEYKFNGTAVVHNDDYIMFIGGTELYIRGQKAIEADRPVAVTMGSDEFGVSCYVDDYNITVYPNELYMPNPETVLFRDGRETEMGLGMQATIDPETKVITVKADKGHYSMLMNGKGLPGEQTGGIGAAADAGDDGGGQVSGHVNKLFSGLDADHALEISHHHGEWMGAEHRPDAVNGVVILFGVSVESGVDGLF